MRDKHPMLNLIIKFNMAAAVARVFNFFLFAANRVTAVSNFTLRIC